MGTWAVKVPVLAGIKFVNSINTLVTMGENVGKIGTGNFWESVSENATVRFMEDYEKKFKDIVAPTYKSINYDQKGFWNKLGDATFWNDSFADGVAFVGSAFIPGGAIGKLGTLGALTQAGKLSKFAQIMGASARTVANGGSKGEAIFGKGLEFLTGARNTAGVAAHIVNTTSESALEAVGGYRKIKQDLIDQ